MNIGVYNFCDRYVGNTSNKVVFTITKTEEEVTTPIDLTNTIITFSLKTSINSGCVLEYNQEDKITITDAQNGVFQLDSFIVDLKPLNYMYSISVEFQDGTKYTYLKGSFNVEK